MMPRARWKCKKSVKELTPRERCVNYWLARSVPLLKVKNAFLVALERIGKREKQAAPAFEYHCSSTNQVLEQR